jgi:hypothetical protein
MAKPSISYVTATAGLLALAASAAACAPAASAELRVERVEALGVIEAPPGIVGRDGGVSGLFRGRSVWVYGDSVTTTAGTYPSTWRNNTMSWTEDLDGSDGLDGFVQPTDALGAPREFFPRTAEEAAFDEAHFDHGDGTCADPCGARIAIWGSGPLEDPERDRALLTYAEVYAEPGAWSFTIRGTSIAVWEDFDAGPTRPMVSSPLDDPYLLFDGEAEGEYAIPAIHEDALYLFSCSGGPEGSSGCRLARAPLGRVLERDAWVFRASDGWSPHASEAAVLFEGSPNLSVHWNEHVGRWLAFYLTWGKIVVRTAPALEGPWSEETEVYVPPEGDAIHGLAHAELQQEDGRVEHISYLAEEFRLLRVMLEPG